jgi:RNA polymerase sigma factor (sigma-70 family)
MSDFELLRTFRETGCEESFRKLVQRHLGMVYSVALRKVRNSGSAEEVAHAVFIALARKAGSLSDSTILAGWLYRATRFAAGKLLRDEERRARHEKEAAMAHMNERSAEQEVDSWIELGPKVFQTLDTLARKDRDAILIRFIENRSFADVAAAIGTTEAAAKMRTGRALEKLRQKLSKRGVSVLLETLSSRLTAPPEILPTGLAASVTAAALGKSAATLSETTLAGSVLSAFVRAKVLVSAAAAAALVLGGLITLLLSSPGATIQDLTANPDDIVRRNQWTVDGRNAQSNMHQGRPAIDFAPQPGRGIAWREGLNFSEGVIEVDIAAFTGHTGIAFWVQDSQRYSAVYFRPQNRPEDPISGNRGIQYVALPNFGWRELRSEFPGVYENRALLPGADSGEWFHVRLEVNARQAQAWINNSAEPCLVVNDLLTTNKSGSVGFFMGEGSSGIYSNLRIQPARQP